MQCLSIKLETRPDESCWVKITARSNLGMLWSMSTTDCTLRGGRGWSLRFGALVLTGDFSHLVVCWKGSTALGRQSRTFLECIFVTQTQEQGSRDWLLHASLALCWGARKKWGWEGSQSTVGCGWVVTGCSSCEVTDVAELGRWATELRLWVSRLTYSWNSLWEAAAKKESPQKS